MLPAFIQINSGILSKNGFSYEYHYDFNQLGCSISQNASTERSRSKDDCIVRLRLRCYGCDFTLNKQDSRHILSKVSKLVAG